MKKKYVRGHATRGDEVLNEIEKLGWVCDYRTNGFHVNHLYIFSETHGIAAYHVDSIVGQIILECFEEIKLPPIFEPKEFPARFITEPKKNGCCSGCCFLIRQDNGRFVQSFCNKIRQITYDCGANNIIFKEVII